MSDLLTLGWSSEFCRRFKIQGKMKDGIGGMMQFHQLKVETQAGDIVSQAGARFSWMKEDDHDGDAGDDDLMRDPRLRQTRYKERGLIAGR